MNGPILTSPSGRGRGGRNVLAVAGTVLLVGIALSASRSSMRSVPADNPKDNKPEAPNVRRPTWLSSSRTRTAVR
jgi:hypothetical protein